MQFHYYIQVQNIIWRILTPNIYSKFSFLKVASIGLKTCASMPDEISNVKVGGKQDFWIQDSSIYVP